MKRRNQGPVRAFCFDPELHKESCQIMKELAFLHPAFLNGVKISALVQTKMALLSLSLKEANGQFVFVGNLSWKDPVCCRCARI